MSLSDRVESQISLLGFSSWEAERDKYADKADNESGCRDCIGPGKTTRMHSLKHSVWYSKNRFQHYLNVSLRGSRMESSEAVLGEGRSEAVGGA